MQAFEKLEILLNVEKTEIFNSPIRSAFNETKSIKEFTWKITIMKF